VVPARAPDVALAREADVEAEDQAVDPARAPDVAPDAALAREADVDLARVSNALSLPRRLPTKLLAQLWPT